MNGIACEGEIRSEDIDMVKNCLRRRPQVSYKMN